MFPLSPWKGGGLKNAKWPKFEQNSAISLKWYEIGCQTLVLIFCLLLPGRWLSRRLCTSSPASGRPLELLRIYPIQPNTIFLVGPPGPFCSVMYRFLQYYFMIACVLLRPPNFHCHRDSWLPLNQHRHCSVLEFSAFFLGAVPQQVA